MTARVVIQVVVASRNAALRAVPSGSRVQARVAQAAMPSSVPAFLEEAGTFSGLDGYFYVSISDATVSGVTTRTVDVGNSQRTTAGSDIYNRHGDLAMYVFVDGHASAESWKPVDYLVKCAQVNTALVMKTTNE